MSENRNVLETQYRTMTELLNHMQDSGRRHNYYHHYTNFDSIKKILKTKTILLSRIDRMNDKQELEKITLPDVAWQSAFSTSFTYGTKENMALWGLYSVPGESGVRLSIDQKELIKVIDNSPSLKKLGGDGDIMDVNEGYSINLYEVLYASNYNNNKEYSYKYMIRDRVYFSNNYIGNLSNENGDARELVGTFKNEAWSYEQEVRLRVKFDYKSAFERLILDISEIDMSKVIITFSPWVGAGDKDRLKTYIKNLGYKFLNISYNNSDFTELVNYRDKCDYCIHEKFVSKDDE